MCVCQLCTFDMYNNFFCYFNFIVSIVYSRNTLGVHFLSLNSRDLKNEHEKLNSLFFFLLFIYLLFLFLVISVHVGGAAPLIILWIC